MSHVMLPFSPAVLMTMVDQGEAYSICLRPRMETTYGKATADLGRTQQMKKKKSQPTGPLRSKGH